MLEPIIDLFASLYLDFPIGIQGLPFVAPDPYLIPEGEYEGANGKGEPPSQEKAMQRVVGVPPIIATASRSIHFYSNVNRTLGFWSWRIFN